MIKLTRNYIVEAIIDDDTDTILEHNSLTYITGILEKGFKGYENYTNEELKKEYNERLGTCEEIEII